MKNRRAGPADMPGIMPGVMLGLAFGAAGLLPGCSSLPKALNPIELYRDATGVSADDPGGEARNEKNLEAGSEKDFPDLASVPPAPTHALSMEEREALTQKLVADRANARYTDEELRFGQAASVPPPSRPAAPPSAPPESAPPAPPAAQAPVAKVQEKPPAPPSASASGDSAPADASLPRESTLASPTLGNLPEPQIPTPPPPAPVPAPSAQAPYPVAAHQDVTGRSAAAGRLVGAIAFATGSARVPAGAAARITEIAALQKESGAPLRVIGHAGKGEGAGGGGEGAGQLLSGFKVALDRANAVAEALGKAGVVPDRIYVETAIIGSERGAVARQAEIFLQE